MILCFNKEGPLEQMRQKTVSESKEKRVYVMQFLKKVVCVLFVCECVAR